MLVKEGTVAWRTVFLSRLIGLYCILMALSLSLRGRVEAQTIAAILRDPPMMLVLGAIVTIAGLAMVLGHNVWSGGALPVMVTLAGWITLAKGLLLLDLPMGGEVEFFLRRLHYQELFYVYVAIALLVGLWFTWRGFRERLG